jgi:hypothetical protein
MHILSYFSYFEDKKGGCLYLTYFFTYFAYWAYWNGVLHMERGGVAYWVHIERGFAYYAYHAYYAYDYISCIFCILCIYLHIIHIEHNQSHPLNPVLDPSSELIGITILFIEWYNLYRRRFPPKDQVDLQDLTSVGERCEHIYHILHILHILYVLLTCVYIEGTWNSVG